MATIDEVNEMIAEVIAEERESAVEEMYEELIVRPYEAAAAWYDEMQRWEEFR